MPGGNGQRHVCVLHEWRRRRKLEGLCRQRAQMDQVRAPKYQLDHGSRTARRREQLHLRRHARHVLRRHARQRGRHCRRHRDSRVRHVAIAATTSTLALTAAAKSLSASIATAVAATLTAIPTLTAPPESLSAATAATCSVRRRWRVHLQRVPVDGHVAHRNRGRGARLHAQRVGLPHAYRRCRGSRHRFRQRCIRRQHCCGIFNWDAV